MPAPHNPWLGRLDASSPSAGLFGGERFALHDVAVPIALARRGGGDGGRGSGPMLGFGVGIALVALFLSDQRLPVGDRDLVIVGMNFRERQETVAVAAVVDKRRL